MANNKTAGLDFKQAAEQAAAELAEAEASEETAESSSTDASTAEPEQPAVEQREGLFTRPQANENEQPNDVDSFVVDIDGEQVAISELRNGYLRQKDYTQKTQELAKERAELDKARVLWEALQENPQKTVADLYRRVNSGDQLIAESPKPKVEESDLESLIEAKVQERLANDPRLQQWEKQSALERVNSIFEQIEQDWDLEIIPEDRQAVLERAIQERTENLEAIFALMMRERDKLEAQSRNAKNASTSTGRRSDDTDSFVEDTGLFGSFKDAWKQTLEEEGVDFLFE